MLSNPTPPSHWHAPNPYLKTHLFRIPDSHVPISSVNISKGMSTRHVKCHEKGQAKILISFPYSILSKCHFPSVSNILVNRHHIGIFLDSSHTHYLAINPISKWFRLLISKTHPVKLSSCPPSPGHTHHHLSPEDSTTSRYFHFPSCLPIIHRTSK